MKKLLSILLTIVLSAIAFPSSVEAVNLVNGAKIFNVNCSACHLGGNNVIIASKGLKQDALDKYEMNSLAAITTQVKKGKNAMPAFSGRLNPSQIEDVASYVLQQAQKGW